MDEPKALKPHPPSFLDILKEVYYENDHKSDGQVRHHPSSASFKRADGSVAGSCLRNSFWKATGEAETYPRELTNLLQADFGNGIHDRLLKKLQKSKKITISPEASGRVVVDNLTKEISYRLDGLCSFH